MLSREVNPLTSNPYGMNAIHYAVELKSLPALTILLEGRWNSSDDPFGSVPWLENAWKALDVSTKEEGLLPIHMAVINGSKKILRYIVNIVKARKGHGLLSVEEMLEYKTKYAMTPLLLAVQFNRNECFKYLVSIGANLHVKNIRIQNVLHIAAINNNKPIIDYLMGVDMEEGKLERAKDYRGKFPIQYASKEDSKYAMLSIWTAMETGNLMDIQTLVNRTHGRILEVKHSKDNSRPLHYAVRLGKVPVIRLLIECNATKDVKDGKGKLPKDVAMEITDFKLRQEILDILSSKKKESVLLKSLTNVRQRRPTRSVVELMKEVLGLPEKDVMSSIKPSTDIYG